ncbi:hypothetical protein [Pontibacter mangrovi]|uniref:hypothetical protein n=1 Tax=Pontibacter mangrovi TaxID=2589816 RepID=UPI0015E29F89|nr:hypothetical protein [Pontibacter mangrovi]
MKTVLLIVVMLIGFYLACKDMWENLKPAAEVPALVAARQQWLATAPATASQPQPILAS